MITFTKHVQVKKNISRIGMYEFNIVPNLTNFLHQPSIILSLFSSFLFREIIHKMKRDKKLSNKALLNLVGPGLELLDLEGSFITEKTLNIVKQQGYNLKSLSLKGAGYLLTDHNFVPLIKVRFSPYSKKSELISIKV